MADAGGDEGLGSRQPSPPSEDTQNVLGDEPPETTAAEAETKTSDAEIGAKSDSETAEPETKSETEVGAKADAGTKADAETKAGSESSAKAEIDSGSDAKTETEPNTKAESGSEAKGEGKVNLLLKAAGDAPIMRQRLWKVDAAKQVTWVIKFIRGFIKLAPEESLFVYVSQAFSPAPDQTIGNLLECFGSEGKLVLHYCKTQAWG